MSAYGSNPELFHPFVFAAFFLMLAAQVAFSLLKSYEVGIQCSSHRFVDYARFEGQRMTDSNTLKIVSFLSLEFYLQRFHISLRVVSYFNERKTNKQRTHALARLGGNATTRGEHE